MHQEVFVKETSCFRLLCLLCQCGEKTRLVHQVGRPIYNTDAFKNSPDLLSAARSLFQVHHLSSGAISLSSNLLWDVLDSSIISCSSKPNRTPPPPPTPAALLLTVDKKLLYSVQDWLSQLWRIILTVTPSS